MILTKLPVKLEDDYYQVKYSFFSLEILPLKSAKKWPKNSNLGRVKAWNNLIVTVDWADPINSPASEIMDKVKVLYVKNLASTVTEECLVTTFSAYGEVEKAKKLKGYVIKNASLGFLRAERNFSSGLWSPSYRPTLDHGNPNYSLMIHFRLCVCPFQTKG